MTLKEIVAMGILYTSLLTAASIGIKKVDGYNVRRIGGQTELWPAPGNSSGCIVDENNEGVPDRKYISVGGGFHGTLHVDRPLTDQDYRVFRDITSKL